MKKTILTLISALTLSIGLHAQNNYLNWMVSAQAGSTSSVNTNYNGALMIGFKNEAGQQISIGPVIKGFISNNHIENLYGAQLYSKITLINNIGLYMQCNALRPSKMQVGYDGLSLVKTSTKLETSMGVECMILSNLGMAGGYNFQEYNPVKNAKIGTMSVRLIYNLSLSGNNY